MGATITFCPLATFGAPQTIREAPPLPISTVASTLDTLKKLDHDGKVKLLEK